VDDPPMSETWPELRAALAKLHVGSLAASATIAPGDEHAFEFALAWHFPNRPRAWVPGAILQPTNAGEVVRNHYATRFEDAWAAGSHALDRLPELEERTRAFHD